MTAEWAARCAGCGFETTLDDVTKTLPGGQVLCLRCAGVRVPVPKSLRIEVEAHLATLQLYITS